ncbi:MAG TPA: STM4012 family radical SAM protein [Burkholderiaceae bacterium]
MADPLPSADPGSLAARLARGPYEAYSYSYPHKSAYRPLDAPQPLAPLWAAEDRRALFGYVHVPFCTMRCGFCNLFAMAQPEPGLVDAYVAALLRQMRAMDAVLGERRFARFAIGGGTPTYLSPAQLATVLEGARRVLGIEPHALPSSIECSPETVTRERLAVCRDAGIARVSMGIQSFSDAETRTLARPQQNAVVAAAIAEIRRAGFPVMNLDLIYGIAGQTPASLLASIDSALAFAPEELYLYPLYVREATGLGRLAIRRADAPAADHRAGLYALARDRLRAAGYEQVSMRMFRAPHAPAEAGPVYCCQDDGMVGLGAGARSYTSALHYSGGYAVERAATRDLVRDFVELDEPDFASARHGFALDVDERRRRYLVQSLLTRPGLRHDGYAARFGRPPRADFPALDELLALGLAQDDGELLSLTEHGLACSDSIGPWLASPRVRALMAGGAGHEAADASC